jgi:purine-binding chemotaxis protein CheW
VLRERAAALAVRPPAPVAGDTIRIVEIRLAGERWGIEPSFIREIAALTTLTPIPCTPPWVPGIVSIRGEIVSLIDLRRFFDLRSGGLSDLDKVIVLEQGGMTFGILADAVGAMRTLPMADLLPPLPTLTGEWARSTCAA